MSVVTVPLLGCDERLPQRDLLLDDRALTERLERIIGGNGPLRIDAIERLSAKYRPGESLRLALRVHAGSATAIVGCRAYPPGAATPGEAVGPETGPGPFRGQAYDASVNTLFWTFPRDRRIRHLDALFPSEGNVPVPGWRSSRLLRYIPEKRATAAMLDHAGAAVAYMKVYAPGGATHAAETLRAVGAELGSADGAPRLPRVLGCLPNLDCVAIEALSGRPLGDEHPERIATTMNALGVAVAILHATPATVDGARDDDDTALDERTLGLLGADVAERVAGVQALLSPSPPPDAQVCLHGDLHFGNVLVGDGRIGLIDTDLAGAGPAAKDLAEVIVRLRLRQRLGTMDAATGAEAEQRFLDGYSTVRPVPTTRSLDWHVAHKLLSRVYAAVRQVRPELLRHVDEILDAAEEAAS
jgi:Phosphotransferase enzyme family